MPQYTEDQLWKLYEKLPQELKEAIFSSENADDIFEICDRHKVKDTSKEAVETAKKGIGMKVSILKPECIPVLQEYAKDSVIAFYILSPEENILRDRLIERGEHSAEEINQRIKECAEWDEKAKSSGISYVFIANNGTIEELVEQVEIVIQEKSTE